MSDEQKEILRMLSEGTISVEEAERLLGALEQGQQRRQTETDDTSKNQQPVREVINSLRDVVAGIGPFVGRMVGEISTEIQKDHNFPGESDAEELPPMELQDSSFIIADAEKLFIRSDKDGGSGSGDLVVETIDGNTCRLEADEARNLRVLHSNSGPVIRWAGGPLKVQVPKTVYEVYAYTLGGDMRIDNLQCPSHLKSMSGDMMLGSLPRQCYAKALGGNIKCRLGPAYSEPFELVTMGGNIRVEVSPDTPGISTEAITMGGSIVVEDELGKVKKGINLGRQKVKVLLGNGDPVSSLRVKTMGGNIEIRRARDE